MANPHPLHHPTTLLPHHINPSHKIHRRPQRHQPLLDPWLRHRLVKRLEIHVQSICQARKLVFGIYELHPDFYDCDSGLCEVVLGEENGEG